MESKRKRSLQVVLTREEKASIAMSTKLRDLGFKPIIFPTIQFVRVYSDYTGPQNFSGYDYLIFTTTRTVDYFFKRFRQRIDPGVKIVAAGPKVLKALQKHKYEPFLTSDTTSLIQLAKELIKNKAGKVVALGAKSNSGKLTSMLVPKGFSVKELPLYTTEPPGEVDDSKLEIINKGYYDIMTFASGSAVKHMMMILRGKVGVFKGKVAIVTNQEIARLVQGSAFGEVIVAEQANEAGLLKALKEYRESR